MRVQDRSVLALALAAALTPGDVADEGGQLDLLVVRRELVVVDRGVEVPQNDTPIAVSDAPRMSRSRAKATISAQASSPASITSR